jgi:lipase chaperone LimK
MRKWQNAMIELEELERLIANDQRNLDYVLKNAVIRRDLLAKVIADCAVRFFAAKEREHCDDLLEDAEINLRRGVEFWERCK